MSSRNNKSSASDESDEDDAVGKLRREVQTIMQGYYQLPTNDNSYFPTKSGWCLREGLETICVADESMMDLLRRHGPPKMYDGDTYDVDGTSSVGNDVDSTTTSTTTGAATCRHGEDVKGEEQDTSTAHTQTTCFQSLCRIVAGQQLCGSAAKTIYSRLLNTVPNNDLSPQSILQLLDDDINEGGRSTKRKSKKNSQPNDAPSSNMINNLKEPAGLSLAKTKTIIALARAFDEGTLSEETLLINTRSNQSLKTQGNDDQHSQMKDESIRQALLSIKGIGPWSCDMFMMFHLHRSNVLPLHDLGVRKGLAKHFNLKSGKGKNGSLCAVKDAEMIHRVVQPFYPYHSLVTYYMWKVADTKDVYNNSSPNKRQKPVKAKKPPKEAIPTSLSTPPPSSSKIAPTIVSEEQPSRKRPRRAPVRGKRTLNFASSLAMMSILIIGNHAGATISTPESSSVPTSSTVSKDEQMVAISQRSMRPFVMPNSQALWFRSLSNSIDDLRTKNLTQINKLSTYLSPKTCTILNIQQQQK